MAFPASSIQNGAEEVFIPKVDSNLCLECNPLYSVTRQSVDDWCIKFWNLQSNENKKLIMECKFGLIGALCYPKVTDSERFSFISTFLAWWFLVDDGIDKQSVPFETAKALVADHKNIVWGCYKGPSSSSLEANKKAELEMFNKLWMDMSATMTKQQHKRFSKFVVEAFDWFQVEKQKQRWKATTNDESLPCSEWIPTVEEYLWLRRGTSGVMNMIALIEYGAGLDLEAKVLESADVKALEKLGIEHVMLSNDIMSFNKEWKEGNYLNIVPLIAYNAKCSLQEAMYRACKMLEAIESEYHRVRKSIMENQEIGGTDGVVEYMDGIASWMSGNHEWGWITARYNGVEWEPPSQRCGAFPLSKFGSMI